MIDWAKTAFLFPGQNSQFVGMGQDVADTYEIAHTVFDKADDILGRHLSTLCFTGPEDTLNLTENTQPAVYVCSMAILEVLRQELPDLAPIYLAGHSLGEFTALTASGSLDFEDGLRLVQCRADLMRDAGNENPGSMAALLGLDPDKVHEICQQASQLTNAPIVLANDNCPGQTVISGDASALEKALELASEAGAKRTVKLNVSVAAHSPLMKPASEALNQQITATHFQASRIPVIGNVNATPLSSVELIQEELSQQLTQSVRWTETIQIMLANGCDTFVEIGPGKVLTGLLKRIDRTAKGINVSDLASLEAFIALAKSEVH